MPLAIRRFTMAIGVLDHARWTQSHSLTPLTDSLNPADFWAELRNIPQIHFVGGQDAVTGPAGLIGYLQRYPKAQQPHVVQIEDFSHPCCWSEVWKDISPLWLQLAWSSCNVGP